MGAAVVALLAVPPVPARAQSWSPRDAEGVCKDQLRRDYGISNTRGVTSSERGNGRFQVTGHADRANQGNNQTARFDCWVERGSVRNVNLGDWEKQSGNGSGDAVAAVGAAIVLGAIIAAATSKKKSHEHDRYPDGYQDNNYGSDSFSPAGGITCYRQQRACFDGYNNYNAGWTSREFGY
ncbi:hypothetical protein GGQ62_000332 [Polymorphobacter fuscus]|uniref:hypothetical protein n=1 Tax=Sandarakinorhabdus fusca TaxID=1439888 RepID=UPI001431BC4B|nr:hypothetical protein [Polymorphobacter fuscus]NJC07334.1 hypothetical protein [Polymorphobacter fuscus]